MLSPVWNKPYGTSATSDIKNPHTSVEPGRVVRCNSDRSKANPESIQNIDNPTFLLPRVDTSSSSWNDLDKWAQKAPYYLSKKRPYTQYHSCLEGCSTHFEDLELDSEGATLLPFSGLTPRLGEPKLSLSSLAFPFLESLAFPNNPEKDRKGPL